MTMEECRVVVVWLRGLEGSAMYPCLWVFSPAMGVQGRKPACYVGSVWGIASVGFKRGALAKGPFCGQITVFFVPLEAYFCQCHI